MNRPVWEGTEAIMDFIHNRECNADCQNRMDRTCFAYHTDEIEPALENGRFECEKMIVRGNEW